MDDDIDKLLRARALRLIDPKDVADVIGGWFVLAGGALSSDNPPKDYDIFCPSFDELNVIDRLTTMDQKWIVVDQSYNAITAKHAGGQTIQFCSYFKESPEKLIESFDFSHCQAAAVFGADGEIMRTVCTQKFIDFVKYGYTHYTRSDYPLSSLMRCARFISRGLIREQVEWKPIILDILIDIVSRGFKDREDFIDQCASISDSFKELNFHEADELFELLVKEKVEL